MDLTKSKVNFEEFARMWNAGETYDAIAKRFDVGVLWCRKLRRLFKLEPRSAQQPYKTHSTDARRQKIIELIESGYSDTRIAAIIPMHPLEVVYFRRANGYPKCENNETRKDVIAELV